MDNNYLVILKLELIINERLYLNNLIPDNHYNEVSKIIKDKIRKLK